MGMPATTGLLIALLVLVLVSAACVGALWFMRRQRRAKEALLPQYSEKPTLSPRNSHHKRVSAAIVSPTTQAGLFAAAEKSPISSTSPAAPANLPAIHVTFPEEVGTDGKRTSGRVVVVHMDDKGGVGMAPVHPEDQPPAYTTDGRFVSLDLERIGGLKEKERAAA